MADLPMRGGELPATDSSDDLSPDSILGDARRINADRESIAPGDIAVGVIIGRASEFFDFFTFAIGSALVFPYVFFPFLPRLEGTLWSFLIFSFAFIARPIGTVASLAIQRRYGRAAKLTIALFLMGGSTIAISFLPTYAHIGFAAIVLLSILRIGQGFALGASWDGLLSLLALNAPQNKRGWYAMIGQLGAPFGFIVSAGLFAYLIISLSTADFLDWGWRYPFFVAFAINVVALFARLRLVSTNEYARLLEEHELQPVGALEIMRSQGHNVIIGALAGLASYALFHLVTVFPLGWLNLYSSRAVSHFLVIQIIGAVLAGIGVVVSGVIADRIGRRNTLGTLAVLIALFSLFIPLLLNSGAHGQELYLLLGFTLLGLSYGQAAGAVASNFTRHYRYTGSALTSDLSWLTGAAFAPVIALGLSARFGLIAVTLYLLSGAICTLAVLRVNRVLELND
jgi:MFS family permease